MWYIVSLVDERKLFYKEAHVDATTHCYFAAHIYRSRDSLRTPLSLVPSGMFSMMFLCSWRIT